MNTGTVVSQHNGYIFVRVDGYEDNIFVHATAFPPGQRAIGQLRQGETIEVDAIAYAAPRGYRAGFAKRLGAPEDVVMPPQRTNLKGYVDRMRTDRGFGYIRQESHGEFFFHCSDVSDFDFNNLMIGDRVTFDVEERGDKLRAVNVRLGM